MLEFDLDGSPLAALFRRFPTVSHETYALYDAPLLLGEGGED